ncbi:hypothetical protein [Halovibrio sp. HP20-50]|nr:hypothetical protein [Halovibrio sp. HP20-59]MEA2117289.1 hypothetical protein [Halovibrio sp. HP20-59]
MTIALSVLAVLPVHGGLCQWLTVNDMEFGALATASGLRDVLLALS